MTYWDKTCCHDRFMTWLKNAQKGRAAMLQMARRGRRCLAKNTAVKRKLKNRAGNKHPLLFENRNELPFLFFFGLLWLICFWDLGPLFRMTGRCVDFDLTALWYSEDEEKHQLPHNTVKKWALMDCQHSYLKLKSEHTPTHTPLVGLRSSGAAEEPATPSPLPLPCSVLWSGASVGQSAGCISLLSSSSAGESDWLVWSELGRQMKCQVRSASGEDQADS